MRFWPAKPTHCVLLLLVTLVAACATPSPQRVVLSYPYEIDERIAFDGYRRLAEEVAGVYVRVVTLDNTEQKVGREMGRASGVVNGASGAIVDKEGYIVTPAHIVISDRFNAQVTTIDGRVREATIMDVAPKKELALLKIEPFPGMQVPPLADVRELSSGQAVIGIGTPNNKKGVVTLGEIREPRRAKRIEYEQYGYDDAIELFLEVEPGHSGGPLFNTRGELVGIIASFGLGETRKVPYVSTKAAFAISSNEIVAYLDEVLR